MISWEDAANEARKEFNDGVATPNSVPTQYDNQGDFTKPSGKGWYRCSVEMGEDFQASLGANPRFRNLGMLMVQVFIPESEGDAECLRLANLVRAHFRRLNTANLSFYVPRLIPVGLRGGEYQRNVHCLFDYEDFNT